jgi:predicted DNA-binding protein YlxM (UPF0122 family)
VPEFKKAADELFSVIDSCHELLIQYQKDPEMLSMKPTLESLLVQLKQRKSVLKKQHEVVITFNQIAKPDDQMKKALRDDLEECERELGNIENNIQKLLLIKK